jgi:predicted GNAT family acetyltransferase
MARKLEEYHVDHNLVTMGNRGHGFDREMQEPAVAAAFDGVLAFLKKYLPPN